MEAYQRSVCSPGYAILEFPVEEISMALISYQVVRPDPAQVAAEGFCVEFENRRV
jgi:hypothetical protein